MLIPNPAAFVVLKIWVLNLPKQWDQIESLMCQLFSDNVAVVECHLPSNEIFDAGFCQLATMYSSDVRSKVVNS